MSGENLSHLANLTCELPRDLQTASTQSTVRQRNGRCKNAEFLSSREIRLTIDNQSTPLITDLDQLLAQAKGLDPFLRAKVLEWARFSSGCVPVADSMSPIPAFEKWSEISKNKALIVLVCSWRQASPSRATKQLMPTPRGRRPPPTQGGFVKWAKLKTPELAVEKLFGSYNLDVSRLLDCCRQSIYFHNLADLITCLKVIT